MRVLSLLILIVLSACASAEDQGSNIQSTIENPYAAQAGDDALSQGKVYLDAVTWTEPELVFTGTLPSACNQLRLVFEPDTAGNEIQVEGYSLRNPDEMCAAALQEFEARVKVSGLAAGEYSLVFNGQVMISFTMP